METPEKRNSLIHHKYNSQTSIVKANFYYSNDTIYINEKHIWKSISANVYKDSIKKPISNVGFIFDFLYLASKNNLSASSELIIN